MTMQTVSRHCQMPAGKLLLVGNSCFTKNGTGEKEEPLELRVWRMSRGEVRVTGEA